MNRPVSKTVLIILLVVVLAVIGFFVYSHRAAKVTPTQVTENVPTPTPSQQWPSTKIKDATVKDNTSYYTISATYPIVKDTVISGYFKKYVDDSVAGFKSDTSWATSDSADSAAAGQLTLNITYTEQKTDNADNYIFSNSSYEGGAHGLTATQTFTFSPTGQLISLSNLFTNGLAGLQTIAPYVASQLKSTLPSTDQDFVADGTSPTAENYANFTVQDDSVTFYFDPYQVAPYSDGLQKVTVPVSAFKSIASLDIFSTK